MISLTNPDDEKTLVQFDLRLPEGLSIKETGGEYAIDIAGRTTWRKHSLDANATGGTNATGGITRFLLASSSNATLSGTSGAVIAITLAASDLYQSGDVKLENILLVTPEEKEIFPSDVVFSVSTGIEMVNAVTKNNTVYTLSGQRLAAPKKGINIVGGKKVITGTVP